MATKSEIEKLTLDTATKILCAEIQNGLRTSWLNDIKEERMSGIIERSIEIADILVGRIISKDVDSKTST